MAEIQREPNLRVGSELAIEFGEYLLKAADFFNGEPFLQSDEWQVDQRKTRESRGGITEMIEFVAERNEPDEEDEELDDDIEFYITVEICRPTFEGEFTPNHEASDPGLVFDSYYDKDGDSPNLKITEHTVVAVAEVWRYTIGLCASYIRKNFRFDYYDSDDDLVASLYPGNSEGLTSLLADDIDRDIMMHKLDNQLEYEVTSKEAREIAGILNRLGYVAAFELLPEGLK